jgi:hypothetical protein
MKVERLVEVADTQHGMEVTHRMVLPNYRIGLGIGRRQASKIE